MLLIILFLVVEVSMGQFIGLQGLNYWQNAALSRDAILAKQK
jgi:hypothetical protein